MKTWRDRIVEARARGAFTEEDRELAASWETCAVGEQRELHGDALRTAFFVIVPTIPQDPTFCKLGGAKGFNGAVGRDDFDAAESFLDKIEDRALVLKRDATC